MIVLIALLAILSARDDAGCVANRALTSSCSLGPECVVDHRDKLVLCSAPKAASTSTFAIMVARANATSDFYRWATSEGYQFPSNVGFTVQVHRFVREVLSRRPEHRPLKDYLATCSDPAWLCIMAVRHPFDRAISSFLHVAATPVAANWLELIKTVGKAKVLAGNYSFREHVEALELTQRMQHRAQKRRRVGGENHFMPQHYAEFGMLRPEDAAAGEAQDQLDDLGGGLDSADREFRGGKLGFGKIVTRSANQRSNYAAAGRPKAKGRALAEQTAASPAATSMTYASTLCGKNGGFKPHDKIRDKCRRVLGGAYAQMQGANKPLWRRVRCLFAHDFRLYTSAVCKQKWLRKCASCVARACV
ncbi:hypothetical protein T492DRAFT_832382 [Pavlovales sp. CCMP2436]|nr:hypothetical protein T492DRAFT_832382 [Pavlovales sp. CCMP2436]